jgi:hypothetical protein
VCVRRRRNNARRERERERKRAGYTQRQRLVPLGLLLFCCVVSFVFASTGLAENERFSSNLTGDNPDSLAVFVPQFLDTMRDRLVAVRRAPCGVRVTG